MKCLIPIIALLLMAPGADGQPLAPTNGWQVRLEKDVCIGDYFDVMDSLASAHQLSEHLIVHANPWLIDSLAATDYYRQMARGRYQYDQKKEVILPRGSVLAIPSGAEAEALQQDMDRFRLDLNIPEYRLRIFRDSIELYSFPVRVGQNRKRYLEMSGRVTDLRTQPGRGAIVRHSRDPVFYNPVTYHRFYYTRRDDDSLTVMPRIPWIETEINGVRNGQMIHPTTNPETLEKPYSNGCIGTREGDAWIIYYYAPIGTPITIRYDLQVPDGNGGVRVLPDVYGWRR